MLTLEQYQKLEERPLAAILVVEGGLSVDEALALPPDELVRRVLPLPEWPAVDVGSLRNHSLIDDEDAHALLAVLVEFLRTHVVELVVRRGASNALDMIIERFEGVCQRGTSAGFRLASHTTNGMVERMDFALTTLRQSLPSPPRCSC